MRRPPLALVLGSMLGAAWVCGASADAPVKIPNPPPSPAAPASRPGYPASLTPAEAQVLAKLKAYLPEDQVPDTYKVLPPAPKGHSPAREEDLAAYRETRKLKDDARWRLAADDAILTPFSILADESCVLGATLDQTNAPTLVRLLTRTGRDASHIVNKAKEQFKQLRPFVAEGGPICTEPDRDEVAKSYSYPSGHSTYSWAAMLILSETAPDLATPIMARARAYGESRVVCGVHWVSDVEEGRTNASILLAVLHANPDFSADLAEAKLEVAAVRAGRVPSAAKQPAGRCAVEDDASRHTPWAR